MEVKQVIAKVAQLEAKINQSEGVQAHVMKQLAGLGISTIEDANKVLDDLEKEVTALGIEMETVVTKLNNLADWSSV